MLGRWKYSPFVHKKNLVNNKTGKKGCKGLARGNWPLLTEIYKYVDKGWNKLEEKGIAYLSKAQWGKVKKVTLGKIVAT